jgi:NAD(P)-dependent dehydrogenase (short-subunit alcohol dehydrogenase family)
VRQPELAAGVADNKYAASKIAVARWAQQTAVTADWAGRGVRLNVLAPGAVMTRCCWLTNHERKCAAHKTRKNAHPILSGNTHLVVVEGDKTFRYCREAATAIPDQAQADLDPLRQQLDLRGTRAVPHGP